MAGHNHVTPYPPGMDIAKEYALLCKDEQTRDLVYALINMEYKGNKQKNQILLGELAFSRISNAFTPPTYLDHVMC